MNRLKNKNKYVQYLYRPNRYPGSGIQLILNSFLNPTKHRIYARSIVTSGLNYNEN